LKLAAISERPRGNLRVSSVNQRMGNVFCSVYECFDSVSLAHASDFSAFE